MVYVAVFVILLFKMRFSNFLVLISVKLLGSHNYFGNFQITAASLQMVNGEYIYITVEPYPNFLPFGNLSPIFSTSDDSVGRKYSYIFKTLSLLYIDYELKYEEQCTRRYF